MSSIEVDSHTQVSTDSVSVEYAEQISTASVDA